MVCRSLCVILSCVYYSILFINIVHILKNLLEITPGELNQIEEALVLEVLAELVTNEGVNSLDLLPGKVLTVNPKDRWGVKIQTKHLFYFGNSIHILDAVKSSTYFNCPFSAGHSW